ncbi:ECU02_0880 [Encephalitozoon cuniculi GB-M1]|uniref:40S ribosomal protein S8 n=2 Tax=Encephalitozoon cuniculi TaxID=6035 RepID=Q8SWC9_ENCCU|nr:40S ribosomal protein S8 [Encephalitozoon cuniculi GB-M1]7QEP_S8 Chain S8, 40S ribosomal protein S8 [Encephalitozoon cuniculi GB-M1]AGE95604.1 40S ribosomal protein S8 [Encephalitozoon cuniculi]KMV66606.1 40S ribosomal protein S8 [Encephalitozoon cuniculi EcunIII-L]UYI28280.1 ribosomal protein S8 [Encephalitozoon cuniculi]CAD25117.1 ECU02_0880 [Encephalitozoon cuniculi GB-M1]
MGINHRGDHKRRKTGAKAVISRKKRNNRAGSQPSSTKIGERKVTPVRVRGGNRKYKALRLDMGHFKFITTGKFRMAKLLQVVYHPSSNELVRTNTLTKSSVVKISAEPFKNDIKDVARDVDPSLHESFEKGHLYAIITSRPGQVGMAQGHVLQGDELKFYADKFNKKSKEVRK